MEPRQEIEEFSDIEPHDPKTQIVYVVSYGDRYERSVVGVFSTNDEAEAYIERRGRRSEHEIDEFELDELTSCRCGPNTPLYGCRHGSGCPLEDGL